MKDKQELARGRNGVRAGSGVPGRGHSSCEGPEVGKSTENAGDSKRTGVAAQIEANMHHQELARWAGARPCRALESRAGFQIPRAVRLPKGLGRRWG